MANSYYTKTYTFQAFTKAVGARITAELDAIVTGFDSVETAINALDARIDGIELADFFTATSTSSVAIGTGAKSFTLAETDRAWSVGTQLRIAADDSNYMNAVVTTYTGTTALTVNVIEAVGSGTYASWSLSLGVTQTESSKMARFFFANF